MYQGDHDIRGIRRSRRTPALLASLTSSPDQLALWAVLLAAVMVIMAIVSS